MRLLTVRLTISLIVGITLISLLSAYYEVRFQKRALRRDLEHRAEALGDSLADKVEPYLNLKKGSRKELQIVVDRFASREHLAGVAVYNAQGASIAMTPELASRLTGEPAVVQQAATNGQSAGEFIRLGEAPVYVYGVPLHQDEAVVGGLALGLVALCRTREQAQMLSTFVILILAAVGGSMVPRFLMPPWRQDLGWWTPHAWVIDAYQGLLWRDEGAGALYKPWIVLTLIGVAGFLVAQAAARRIRD